MRDETTATDEPTAEETTPAAVGPLGARCSTSADAAWRARADRIMAMTPRDRMLMALSLKEQTAAFLEQSEAHSGEKAKLNGAT